MKALVTLFALLSIASSASAESMITFQKFTFAKVEINGEHSRNVAVVTLNHIDQEAVVEIYSDMCGHMIPSEPGTIKCMAAAMLQSTITVPITAKNDSCGSAIYSGSEDKRPVDGLMVDFTLTDNRYRRCDDMVKDIVTVHMVTGHPRAPHATIYEFSKPVGE